MGPAGHLPLSGVVVLDLSRMLPGATLARMLLRMGARVIKVEDPAGGDPMRSSPPLVDGIGAGFRTFYAGAESICLDLKDPRQAAAVRRLAKHADVLVDSFRPGTLDRWGIGRQRLAAANPSLIVCSLSSYGHSGPDTASVGHDLNFAARSGLLSLLPGDGVPGVQIVDVSAGLLAFGAVAGALFARERTGRGAFLDEPLALSPLPLLALAGAEAAAGEAGIARGILAGECPAYGIYECADGRRIAVGALEPKFWVGLVEALGLGDLAGDGLDTGERGREAARRLAGRFASEPSGHWLALAAERNLPITAVRSIDEAARDPLYRGAGVFEPPARPAPRLGEHTARVLAEAGFAERDIADLRGLSR